MENNLKRRVMSRIYIIYIKNTLLDNSVYLASILFITISILCVSIPNVLHNMPKDELAHTFGFMLVAVRNTEWFLQAMLLGIALWSIVWSVNLARKNISKLTLTRFRY